MSSMWRWPWIVCFLVAISDARHVFPTTSSRSSPSRGVCRRGGSISTEENISATASSSPISTTMSKTSSVTPPIRQQVSVGFVRVTGDDRSSQSAIFYSGNAVYTSTIMEKDSIETLAITSDVLLIMVEQSVLLEQPELHWGDKEHMMFIDCIVKGAARRRDSGFPKLAVLFVVTGMAHEETDASDDAATTTSTTTTDTITKSSNSSNTATSTEPTSTWNEQLISQQLAAALTPDLIASFDIAYENTAEAVYQDVISDLSSECIVTQVEEYQLMIQQVYQTLTNKTCDIAFETAESSFFESSGESNVTNETLTAQIQKDQESISKESENPKPTDRLKDDYDDWQGVKQDMLARAMSDLEKLESQQEEVWLNSDSKVPMLHFGSIANGILYEVSRAVEHAPTLVQSTIFKQVTDKVRVLYSNQLLSLREHFGRKYETVLEEYPDNDQAQVEAISRITEGFRAAAQNAIPELCREGQPLVDTADLSYVSTLEGLLSDMMEATSMRQGVDEDDDSYDTTEGEKKPAKWYKKLAARILVLGVNYIQGWLAWQGIKRAAEQRDKDMPKFPLF